MKNYRLLSVAILSLFVSACLPQHVKEALELKVEELREESATPGVAVTTFTSRGVQWSYGSGHLDLQHSKQVNSTSTLFPVSSISKMFAGISILQLIEKGVLSLETSLAELDQATFHQTVSTKCPLQMTHLNNITIRNLLTHTSGVLHDLPNVSLWWDSAALEDESYPTDEDFVNNFCDERYLYPPDFVPGIAKYSNLGFNLLAQIVEAYGESSSYEEYVYNNIFSMLDMEDSFFSLNENQAQNLVVSHGKPGSLFGGSSEDRTQLVKVLKSGSYAGSIGLNISSNDLAKFGVEILNWTTGNKQNLLNISWHEALSPAAPLAGSSLSIARGFLIYNAKSTDHSDFVEGIKCYGHTGTNYGTKALLYVCPEIDWGIAVMGNARDSKRNEYLFELGQILFSNRIIKKNKSLPRETLEWLELVNDFQNNFEEPIYELPESIEVDTGPYPTNDYVGVYHSDTDGPIEITPNENGRLVFLGAELVPDRYIPDRFHNYGFDWFGHTGEFVEFFRDDNGKVVKVVGYQILNAEKNPE